MNSLNPLPCSTTRSFTFFCCPNNPFNCSTWMIRVYYTYLRLSYGKSKTLKKNKDVLIVSVSFRITKDLKMKSELYEITVVHNKSTVFNSFQFEKNGNNRKPWTDRPWPSSLPRNFLWEDLWVWKYLLSNVIMRVRLLLDYWYFSS